MAEATPPDYSEAGHLGADFDAVRWFELPAVTLAD
jgi:hypothetical protein